MIRKNVIANGVDLYEKYGLVLTDESTYEPPQVVSNYLEVPFRIDGPLDLTEAVTGFPTYGQRQQRLVFLYVGDDYMKVKQSLKSTIHGKLMRYVLPFDPEYTYTGRWSVDEWHSNVHHGTIAFSVVAEPYKLKGTVISELNAAGGIDFQLLCGDKPVCPTIECATETEIGFNGNYVTLNPGVHVITDLWLMPGTNEIYMNATASGYGDVLISSFQSIKIISIQDDRVANHMWSDGARFAWKISDVANDTIAMRLDTTVNESEFSVSGDSEQYKVIVTYDWSDL